jgi:hypothetical protein
MSDVGLERAIVELLRRERRAFRTLRKRTVPTRADREHYYPRRGHDEAGTGVASAPLAASQLRGPRPSQGGRS